MRCHAHSKGFSPLAASLILTTAALGQVPTAATRRAEQAPPPAFRETRELPSGGRHGLPLPAAPTLYSIGDPSDAEQLYLELLNRSRRDPAAEGVRLRDTTNPRIRNAYYQENPDGSVRWIVDTNLFAQAMAAIPPAAPLAFNSKLTAAARDHSAWMLANVVQSHDQDGVSTSQRVTNAGYQWAGVAENVFSYAYDPDHGFAGFEVDWGEGPHGMQEPPGHRNNNHELMFYEIGIGVVRGRNSKTVGGVLYDVGPELVTMNFGVAPSPVAMVTGVAFYDLNGNQFYDEGEGLGGVRVDVSGSSYYAVTSASGGYAVPTANGVRTVTFTAAGTAPVTKSVTVESNRNVKADLMLSYTAPVPAGSASPFVNVDNSYTFTTVPGATGYVLRTTRLSAYATVEGAEQGGASAVADVTPGYTVITTEAKTVEGTHTFHLAHPGDSENPPRDQVLRLLPTFRGGINPQLKFASRVGFATEDQIARAEVSTDEGATWTTVWSQPGNGGRGETSLTRRTVSLAAAVAGRQFQVRFVFAFSSGSWFPQADPGFGLYLDEIAFTDVEQVIGTEVTPVSGANSFVFRPSTAGTYGVALQAVAGARPLPFSTPLIVTAIPRPNTPVIALSPPVIGPNGKIRLDFAVTSGSASNFALERAPAAGGPWSAVADATLSAVSATSYTYRFTPTESVGFLRVKVQ